MTKNRSIRFRATLPQIQSAIRIGGDVCRVTFDIPRSDLANAVALAALQDSVLRITVEIDDGHLPVEFELRAEEEENQVLVVGEREQEQLPVSGKDESRTVAEKGPHGKLWQILHRKQFHYRADVQHALGLSGVPSAYVKKRLYERFGVTSQTFISADELCGWLNTYAPTCDGAITMVRSAELEMLNPMGGNNAERAN